MKSKDLSNIILAGGVDLYDNKNNTFFSKSLQNFQYQFYEDVGSKYQTLVGSYNYLHKEKKYKFVKSRFNSFETNLKSIDLSLKKHPISQIVAITYLDTVLKKEVFYNLIEKFSKEKKTIVTLLPVYEFNLVSSSKEVFKYKGKYYRYGGICILNKDTVKEFSLLIKANLGKTLPYIFFNTDFSKKVKFVPLSEDELIEVSEKNTIAKLYFGSKANSLINIQQSLKKLEIPKFIVLHESSLNKNTYQKMLKHFNNKSIRLMLRSNSNLEDSFESSNAGKFLTIGPISLKDKTFFMESVKNVFDSYGKEEDKSVLIQEFVEDITQSGVVTSFIPGKSLNYYSISISEFGDFDNVTAGTSNNIVTIYLHRSLEKITSNLSSYKRFFNAIKQVENITQHNSVDVELINTTKKSFLVQARPLVSVNKNINNSEKEKHFLLKEMRKFQSLSNETDGRFGLQNFYSNMSDWNPAEIIGKRPKKLSILLYDYMITRDTWNKQRVQFGYRYFKNSSLMTTFGDSAYIDVKKSLNSFLPKKINSQSCEKIINFQIDQLVKNPENHDKIEFKIAESAYNFESYKYLQKKYKYIIDEHEIKVWDEELKRIYYKSNKIHDENSKTIFEAYKKISKIQIIDQAFFRYVKNYMALPFAHHARIAFLYMSQLKQLVELGVIEEIDSNNLMSNIDSVSHQMRRDAYLVKINKKSISSFIRNYGHVRPGNYDINSKNLRNSIDEIVTPMIKNSTMQAKGEKDDSAVLKIDNYLKKIDFNFDGQTWVNNFKNSIASRENSKFYYSKGLDMILCEFEKNEILHNNFIEKYSYNKNIYKGFGEDNHGNVFLPDTINRAEDFFAFKQIKNKPNFQGLGSLKGKLQVINSDEIQSSKLKNSIVLIDSADPGWDWIFSFNIRGLITKYGGPNSHMAIRCAENKIPCVMGLGDSLYDELLNYKLLNVNFENETIAGE